MPQLDRTTARALVEAGYMPLSHYIEMFEPHLRLQEVESPSTAPDDKWKKLERLFASITFTHK
jgi:hypothetical protein